MKNFIKNKKVIITFSSCLVVILLVFIGITAMRMVAKNSSIGEEAAKKFAYIDAGVKEKNVNHVDVDFEYKDSTYVYSVEFDTDKKEYHYYVNASNGIITEKKIIKKKFDSKKDDKKKHKKNNKKKTSGKDDESDKTYSSGKKIKETTKKVRSKKDSDDEDDASEVIGMDAAKSIAVSSAGESMGNVVFTLAVLNGDTYDLQFYNSDTEYNYSIDAFSGSVVSGYSTNYGGSDSE
ncbi:MAG: PepSY domain-containing protein [Eubacterium sp.]|nr:PepSY domain-containing protein [Eubacterium sp.]